MASPTKKRKVTDITGYIHSVSPQKANKSFRLQIQTGDKLFKKAICFDDKKYKDLTEKSVSGDPVILRKIVDQDDNPNTMKFNAEFIINRETKIDDIDVVNLDFQRGDPEMTYTDLTADLVPGTIISLKAKLDIKHAIEKTVLVGGSRNACVLNQMYLLNDSGVISFTAWDEWIHFLKNLIENKHEYLKFHNLLVKEFGGEVYLTTCSETRVEIIDEEAPNIEVMHEDYEEPILIGEFDAVTEILYSLKCTLCDRTTAAVTDKFVVCVHCKSMNRKDKMEEQVLVRVAASEIGSEVYTFDAKQIIPYVKPVNPISFKTDKVLLMEKIMALKSIKVVCGKRNTITIEAVG